MFFSTEAGGTGCTWKYGRAYKEFFPVDPPARSTIQIGKFNHGMAIEIEAIATIKEENEQS